jgi:cyanophycinase
MEYSSMDEAKLGEPVSLVGIQMHVLLQGARYDLHERRVTALRSEVQE